MTEELEYNFKEIESKWQEKWKKAHIFESDRDEREKYFINFPFPYINGAPHLGHGYSLLKGEAMARYQRMQGKNVLFPLAFHATGEPIVGMAKRVKAGDESQIRSAILSGVPKNEVSKFEDPAYIVEFFKNKWIETAKGLGLAVDWRRKFVTTTLTPVFSKFIEWQYRKLKADGYVVQGSHPVIWCPSCGNPTGDHDRLEGEGARVVDFVLIKFKSEKHDAYFLPATLRLETTYGVTNMFLHPDATYVKITIDGENYIVAKEAVIKFKDQQFEITDETEIPIEELIGSYVTNPVDNREILVMPGEFIDYGGSSGVVMSVPAHAPMDWIALQDLKEDSKSLERWSITDEMVQAIEPISLIEVPEYGEFPAKEAIESIGAKNMHDPLVKEATKTIYRREHNNGVLKAITQKYAGETVSGVKDQITEDFINNGISFILKEPGEKVVCRCGTRNHVKYLENQWFLAFGNKEWKEKTHKLLDSMNIIPSEVRASFDYTIDWLENKACARKSGLGTPLPWDHDWIVETLSDSVIYMVYYIISKYVNSGEFLESYAVDEVFDYLILEKGDIKAISDKYEVPRELLQAIREDVDYYYGYDLRTSAKDLVTNHLTFSLMHHTAIFPEKYWPKAYAVNGYVSIIKPGEEKAEKMSKSKGNFQTIQDVIDAFGVDATRLGFLIAGEGMKDAQFSLAEGESYVRWLQSIYEMAFEEIDDDEVKMIDNWLYSRIQLKIKETREFLENMETRSAFQAAYHEIMNDIRWYLKRRSTKGPAYRYAIETSVRLVTPFVPHLVEEIWTKWGRDGFASDAPYPEVDESKVNLDAEYGEKVLSDFMDDLRKLRTFLKEKGNPDPKSITIFISEKWKYDIYARAYKGGLKTLMKSVMSDPEMRKMGKVVSKYAQHLLKQGGPPDIPWTYELEWNTINEAKEYIERTVDAPIEILYAADSEDKKADAAIPRRPGFKFNDA